MTDTVIRAMIAADAHFDRQLFDEDRGAQFAPLGLTGPMLTMLLDQQFRAHQLGIQQNFPGAEYFIIACAGVPVGRLTTGCRDRATLHIIDIVLLPLARQRGVGTNVLNSLCRTAKANGATQMTLSVLRSNTGAIRLYERLGFVATADDDDVHFGMIKPLG